MDVTYDRAVSPDRAEWLALDEGEQIALVEDYHRRGRIDLPQATLHVAILWSSSDNSPRNCRR